MPWRKLPYCIFLICALLFEASGYAQNVQLNIFVNPQAPADFSKWNGSPGQFQMSANNTGSSAEDVRIKFDFKDRNGNLVASTSDIQSLPTITLQVGANTIASNQVFSTDYFNIAKDFEASLGRNGNFPAGQFDLCASAISVSTGQVISTGDVCGFFEIERLQSPLLIFPTDGYHLCGRDFTNIVFQWTPALPNSITSFAWNHFVLCEQYPGQSPMEAIQSNIPIVEQFIPININQWQWPENLIAPGDSQNYVWGVNIYDGNDQLVANYNYPYRTVCREDLKDTFTKNDTLPPTHTTDTFEHPHTYTRDRCSSPGYKLLKGSEVTVGMTVDQPGLFPYPRAVPIRADGKDKDVVTLLCSGCKGPISELPITIRDDVGNFEWKLLSEKGSLNTPFDLNQIDSLAQQIARLMKRLQAINDSLADIKQQLDKGLDEKKAKLQADIDHRNADKKDLQDQKQRLQSSLDSLQKVISDKEKTAADVSAKLNQEKAEIKKLQTRIDSLNKALKGGAGADEQALLKQIGEKRKALETMHADLENQENAWLDELDKLNDAVLNARNKIEDALKNYTNAKDKLEALAKQITYIQSQSIKSPDGKKFLQVYEDWEKKLSLFETNYDKGNSLKDLGNKTTDAGLKALSTTVAATRNQYLSDLNGLMADLLNKANNNCKGGNDNAYCKAALNELSEAGNGYEAEIAQLVPGTFVFDIVQFKKIDTLRNAILGGEGSLVPLKNALQAAVNDYQKAVDAYNAKQDDIDKQRQKALDDMDDAEKEVSDMEAQLKEMADKRIADEDDKRSARLEQLSDLKQQLQDKEDEVAVLGDSLFNTNTGLDKAKGAKADLQAEMKKLDDDIKGLDDIIDALKKQIDKLNEDRKNLEKKQKDLEKEKKEIEAKIAELMGKKAEKQKGNKTASGPIVYYIPPPLEDIIKDQAKFQELKDSVTTAEVQLQLAYANKDAVQGKLAKEIEKIANNLVKYKAALKTIEDSKKKIEELEDDIAKNKTKKYQDYLAKQQEAQTNSTKAKEDEDKAEKDEKTAEEKKDDAEKELDEAKDKVKEIKEALAEMEKDFKERQNEIAYEEKLLTNARSTLQDNIAAVEAEETHLQELILQLGRLNNDLTRASALNKDDQVAAIRAQIQQTEADIKLSRDTKLPSLRIKVESSKSSVEAAVKRVDAVHKKDDEAMLKWKEKLEELRDESGNLIKKNEKFEAAVNKLDEQKRKKEEAEKAFEDAEKKREELQEDIAKQVENDDDIKKKSGSKKEAEDAQKKAEEDKATIDNDIAQSQNFKTKWINDAKTGLDKAKDHLKTAKQNLRDFLIKEFETVSFTADIQLEGKDKVVDKWRTGDGKAIKTAQIIYPASRFFQFTGTPAEDKNPNEPTVVAVCNPLFNFDPPPASSVNPPAEGREPRTIALMYKNGEPIWPEWPVLKNDGRLLAKDAVPVYSEGTDNDYFKRWCNATYNCSPSDPIVEPIKDLGSYVWEALDGAVLGYNALHPWMMWQTGQVDKPQVEKPEEIKIKFHGTDLGADEEVKDKKLPLVRAGVLLECSKDTAAAPEAVYKLQGRVVNGEHKGLPGEDVEFEVKLEKGEATNYGFDGTNMKVTKQTDGDGYAKADFNFGKGYAEFTIFIRWKRGGNVVEEEHMKAVSPLLLKLHRFSTGAPDYAWEAALKLLDGGGDAASAVASFPKKDKDKETDTKTLTLRGVGGLLNFEREFVNDEWIEFSASGNKKTDPAKDKTKVFGLAKTQVGGIKDKESCELTATSEEKYRPVTRPPKVQLTFSSKKANKFKVGSSSNPFIIVMDEPFNPKEPVNGNGRLGMEIAGTEVLQYLKKVTFEIADIELEGEGEDFTATAGEVKWDPGDAGNLTLMGLEFNFKKVIILAQKGAGIEGKVKHNLLPNPVQFKAELDADGNFLGSLDSLPAIEIKKFKLKEGTAFDIDMHDGKSPGTLESSFKGLLIRSAKLELPEVFNGADKTASVLEVSDFYIGSRYNSSGSRSMGFGGKVSLTGSFFKMGYAGYNYAVQELSLEFENSGLKSGGFKGELSLPVPFEGKVANEVSISGEGFTAKVSTDRPITIPKLGVSMTFLSGTGIEYVATEKLGKLTINAFMVTKSMGEIEIKGFEARSDGSIKAEKITLEKSVKFGSGFDLHLKSIGFEVSPSDISIKAEGGFAFSSIPIKEVSGVVTISSGPSIDVQLTSAEVQFESGPVTFSGKLKYSGHEFSGKFDIGIKKLLENGIKGVFVVGSMETKDAPSWIYWYAELTVGVKIPLGQTGLVVLGLGGGVGYNYIPPIGSAEGHPQQNDAFSFKAIMEMGTQPGGEVFAGRMEMVLVPGKFSLYGKTWLLTQKESLYGEGQLNLQWAPTAQVDGFLGMFIGIPDAKGSIFQAQGKINFLFAGTSNFYIRSEVLKASVLQSINGEASVDVNPDFLNIQGKLYYKLNKSLPLGIVTAKVAVNVSADSKLNYAWKAQTLKSNAAFVGNWDVDLETPLGNADITNGAINLSAEFNASPGFIEVKASASISYDVWVYKDTVKLDLGYTSST